MTTHRDGFEVAKQWGWVLGTIASGYVVIGIVMTLWGGQVFASKEALAEVECIVSENRTNREVVKSEMATVKQTLAEIKKGQQDMYTLLLSIKRGQ